MDDILHGGARDNCQRHCPHIKREVLDADNPPVETMEMVFDHIRQPHGQDQHHTDLIQNHPERWPKTQMYAFVDEGKADGHQCRRDEISDEGVSGHLLEIAPQFGGHHGCRSRCRSDDAGEDGLQKDEIVAYDIESDDGADDGKDEQHLKGRHPPMPRHRQEAMEIDLTEDEQSLEAKLQSERGMI